MSNSLSVIISLPHGHLFSSNITALQKGGQVIANYVQTVANQSLVHLAAMIDLMYS